MARQPRPRLPQRYPGRLQRRLPTRVRKDAMVKKPVYRTAHGGSRPPDLVLSERRAVAAERVHETRVKQRGGCGLQRVAHQLHQRRRLPLHVPQRHEQGGILQAHTMRRLKGP